MTDPKTEIDRLYGLPLDEFVAGRGALAKSLRSEGKREDAERVKALRKPTAGAWAINQALRRRRSELADLLAAGEQLRKAHEGLLSGGGRDELRAASERERELVELLADCAEVIASETGKAGPALKGRVRSTLHAAALDDEVRAELEAGRVVREREAVGLGVLGAASAPAPARRAPRRDAKNDRAPDTGAKPEAKRAEAEARAAQRERAERLADAEAAVEEARSAHDEAEAAHDRATDELDSAQAALEDARATERETRKQTREAERELARRERELRRAEG